MPGEWKRRKMNWVMVTFGVLGLCLYQLITLLTRIIAVDTTGSRPWIAVVIALFFLVTTATAWHFERTPGGFKRLSSGRPVERTGKKLKRMLPGGIFLYLLLRIAGAFL